MVNPRNLWGEFKAFAFKGNLIDLAIAVVIGAAFGKVIGSFVENIIMPAISYITPNMTYDEWHVGKIMFGKFLGELLNFFIIALAVFITIVKLLGMIMKKPVAPSAPSEPTVKECPLCLSTIPIKARRCSHCTADLPAVV